MLAHWNVAAAVSVSGVKGNLSLDIIDFAFFVHVNIYAMEVFFISSLEIFCSSWFLGLFDFESYTIFGGLLIIDNAWLAYFNLRLTVKNTSGLAKKSRNWYNLLTF